MANYYAQSPLYSPDPYQTTSLPKHFPEHHYPFEHARHAIGHAFSEIHHELKDLRISEQPLINPCVDARESKTTFHIDVELPGLGSEERMTLKWISTRTLLVGAVVGRPPLPEDEGKARQSSDQISAPAKTEVAHDQREDGKAGLKSNEESQSTHLTIGERRIGTYGRAFNFPVDVNQARATAKLDAGLLRIAVPKAARASQVDKKVSVETGSESQVLDSDETDPRKPSS